MNKREEMVLLMEEFEGSGQSQKQFSGSRGIGFHKFNYWYRKLKRENGEAAGFLQVDTGNGAPVRENRTEVVYPNGVVLKLGDPDPALLARLICLF
jgi:hypothetical protein